MKKVVALLLTALPMSAFAGEDVSALLKAKTQAFSEAGQEGNAAVLAEDLDDHVVFVNEGGDMPTKKDILDSVGPPPKGVKNHIEVTKWSLTQHGSTAVANFTDVLTKTIGSQTVVYDYLSTEVWQKKKGRWLMISSQTLAVDQDPPVVTLPASVLDQYVGEYKLSDDFVYRIARDGDHLTGAMNGGTPVVLQPEMKDVLFTPGPGQLGLRRIFQRDEAGNIVSFLSRRQGRDVVLTKVK